MSKDVSFSVVCIQIDENNNVIEWPTGDDIVVRSAFSSFYNKLYELLLILPCDTIIKSIVLKKFKYKQEKYSLIINNAIVIVPCKRLDFITQLSSIIKIMAFMIGR